jgi:hypothetical protein
MTSNIYLICAAGLFVIWMALAKIEMHLWKKFNGTNGIHDPRNWKKRDRNVVTARLSDDTKEKK